MFTENNVQSTEDTDQYLSENTLKRVGICLGDTKQAKKLKLFDVQESSPSTPHSNIEWDQSPGTFLSHFLFPHMEEGNEEILFDWLRDIKVFTTPRKCKCGSQDFVLQYNMQCWVCKSCNLKFSIWDFSFFKYHRARVESINDVLFCILAWCKKMPIYEATKVLQMKKNVVKNIYSKCASTVEAYVTSEYNKFASFGGEGSVVLIDLQPDTYSRKQKWHKESRGSKRKYGDRSFSLWIADTKYVPTQYWIHILSLPRASLQLLDNFFARTKLSPKTGLDKHCSASLSPIVKEENESDQSDGENQNFRDGDGSPKIKKSCSSNSPVQKSSELRVLKEQQKMHGVTQKQDVKIHKAENKIKKAKAKEKVNRQMIGIEVPGDEHRIISDQVDIHTKLENRSEDAAVCLINTGQQSRRLSRRSSKEVSQSEDLHESESHIQPNVAAVSVRQEEEVLGETSCDERSILHTVKSEHISESEAEFLSDFSIGNAVMEVINGIILPGSLIVANEERIPNICSILQASKKYQAVKSFSEILAVDDTGHRPTCTILDNIWQATDDMSKCITDLSHKGATRKASAFLWRQFFGRSLSDTAYHILHQIASHYDPSKPTISTFYHENFLF